MPSTETSDTVRGPSGRDSPPTEVGRATRRNEPSSPMDRARTTTRTLVPSVGRRQRSVTLEPSRGNGRRPWALGMPDGGRNSALTSMPMSCWRVSPESEARFSFAMMTRPEAS